MKILVVTDIHSSPDKVFDYLDNHEVNQIIITGDVTEFGPENLFIDILNKFSTYAPVHALFGNCDPKNSLDLIEKSNAVNIHDSISNIGDITLVGFGGSNETPFDTPNEYSDELLYEKLSKYVDVLSSDYYTILVTHAPPYDTNADKIESGVHVGSKGVRRIIEENNATINICGHIHEATSQDTLGNTTIINPGDAASGNICILTINDDDIKNKTVNVELIKLD